MATNGLVLNSFKIMLIWNFKSVECTCGLFTSGSGLIFGVRKNTYINFPFLQERCNLYTCYKNMKFSTDVLRHFFLSKVCVLRIRQYNIFYSHS
jgi:hypothetical protein